MNVRNGTGREEMKFWGDVNDCYERGRRVVLIGDMIGRVASHEITGVVEKQDVGVNEKLKC